MKHNLSEQELANLIHELAAVKGLAFAAIKEAAKRSSKDRPLNLDCMRTEALCIFDCHLNCAPDRSSRENAKTVGEHSIDELLAMFQMMGAKRN